MVSAASRLEVSIQCLVLQMEHPKLRREILDVLVAVRVSPNKPSDAKCLVWSLICPLADAGWMYEVDEEDQRGKERSVGGSQEM